MKYLLLIAGLLLSACASSDSKSEWEPLFDGSTLNGWEALPGGEWKVKDGSILGIQEKSEKRHGMLLSKKTYSDFEIKLKYKAIKGNSGFYFRVQRVKHFVSVKGFQAEVDSNGNGQGGLYETLGRSWVVKPNKEQVAKFYKKNEWNEMTVKAVGRYVLVTVNGVKTAELKNDKGLTAGHFGLQLHGSQDMEVYFKDIVIRDLSQKTDVGMSHLTEKIHDKTTALPTAKAGLPEEELIKNGKAPSDAIILFDGTSLDNWKGNWTVKDGVMEVLKGNIATKEKFGSGHLHIEWRIEDVKSPGNSGVFINGMYEVQVFNSHNNRTKIYADGQAAAIYGQFPPAFNVCREPGQWEYYDIFFTAPQFNKDGSVAKKALITVYHNGIRVHHNAELTGPTGHYKRPGYRANVTSGPIMLQDHKNKVQYRNIWFKAAK